MIESEWVRVARRGDRRAVESLLRAEGLEGGFVEREFAVCEADRRIVACARARDLGGEGTELASVVVAPTHRGRGLARVLVSTVLWGAAHPVYALALAPDAFERLGFEPVAREDLPAALGERAAACDVRGRSWTPMRLRRRGAPPLGNEGASAGDAWFLDG